MIVHVRHIDRNKTNFRGKIHNMRLTCRSNFHPSSFNSVFLDICNMAHMATSAALPCGNFTNQKNMKKRITRMGLRANLWVWTFTRAWHKFNNQSLDTNEICLHKTIFGGHFWRGATHWRTQSLWFIYLSHLLIHVYEIQRVVVFISLVSCLNITFKFFYYNYLLQKSSEMVAGML